jgi:ABC-type antimicrobial peptide transport system permease subunit
VVGVAGDYARSIGDPTAPALWYVPPTHSALGSTAANTMIVRPRADATRGMIRDYVRAIAPHLRMVTVAPLSDRFANELRAWQLGAALLTAVGILALVIAAAGLYSMLTFDVMQRRRELGIRAALGASAGDLVRATVATSVVAVTVGVAIGLLASLAGGRVIESLLFQVSARDPVVYAGVCLVLLATGVIAGLLPARTVTRTDPAVPLREE